MGRERWGGRGGNKKPEVKLNTPLTPLMFSKLVLTIVYETKGYNFNLVWLPELRVELYV